MSALSKKFLVAVLGPTGTKALARATALDPALETVIVPRVALSWVQSKGVEYAGKVPGQANSFVKFSKTEKGLSGLIAIDELTYSFEDSTPEHVAAAISVSVGSDRAPIDSVRSLTINRLGKAVDSLFKAEQASRALNEALDKKQLDPSLGYNISHEDVENGIRIHAYDKQGNHVGTAWLQRHANELKPITVGVHEDHQRLGLASAMYNHAKKVTGVNKILPGDLQTDEGEGFRSTYKTELPGQTHKPTKQLGPEEPEAPTKQQSLPKPSDAMKPKLPKLNSLKIEKSEMAKACKVCGGLQFKGAKFVGCLCHRDLAKSIKVTIYSDGAVLDFKSVPLSTVAALRKTFKE